MSINQNPNHMENKVAVLVTMTFTTRVIVSGVVNEEEAVKLAIPRIKLQMDTNGIDDNDYKIVDDTECPFDPEFDEVINQD